MLWLWYEVHETVDFFFFQAEDGIRDIGVTGVQTCALPISLTVGRDLTRTRFVLDDGERVARRRNCRKPEDFHWEGRSSLLHLTPLVVDHRSEERRVGKECRSRWSPYH